MVSKNKKVALLHFLAALAVGAGSGLVLVIGMAVSDAGTPEPPPEEPPENVFGYEDPVEGCLEGKVYFLPEGTQHLPDDYDSLEPASKVYACEWDIPTREWSQGFPGVEDRFEWFAIRYVGEFRAERTGIYHFRISSDDGARLTIGKEVILNNDGVHPPQQINGAIELDEGFHGLYLEYFQGPRYHINLQIWVTPPDGSEHILSVRHQVAH